MDHLLHWELHVGAPLPWRFLPDIPNSFNIQYIPFYQFALPSYSQYWRMEAVTSFSDICNHHVQSLLCSIHSPGSLLSSCSDQNARWSDYDVHLNLHWWTLGWYVDLYPTHQTLGRWNSTNSRASWSKLGAVLGLGFVGEQIWRLSSHLVRVRFCSVASCMYWCRFGCYLLWMLPTSFW